MISPLVSVIIPAYNRAHSVARSIESVLMQTHQPLEVIVVDDGSTDNTPDVLAGFGDRILSIHQNNGGPSSARNTGVSHSHGTIIAFLDSDDTWDPQKLERQVKLMVSGGSRVPCCVCNARNIVGGVNIGTSFEIAGVDCKHAEGYWLNPTDLIATRFLLFNQVVAIRRDAFLRIGGFKEQMRLLEDHDLAFRLSLLGPWAYLSDVLVTKYDETDGIGVQARSDPFLHINAFMVAVRGLLNESIEVGSNIDFYLRRSLRDSIVDVRAVNLKKSECSFYRFIGKALAIYLRIRQGIRRRLPSWPKVKEVRSLDFLPNSDSL